ncbi:DUF5915 domain-containing protein [Bacillus pacificus]
MIWIGNLIVDIVMDELNVKAFHVELDETKYTSYQLKLNFKTAGPKFGKKCECSKWLAKTIITRRGTKLCLYRKSSLRSSIRRRNSCND